jgi:hypothetical protein
MKLVFGILSIFIHIFCDDCTETKEGLCETSIVTEDTTYVGRFCKWDKDETDQCFISDAAVLSRDE